MNKKSTQSIAIRLAAPSDISECHLLDVLAWGEASAASESTLSARVAAHPFGNLVALDIATGRVVGSIWTVACVDYAIESWWQASGHARYEGVLDAHADLVFGVSIAAHPEYQDQGVEAALMRQIGELSWAAGKRRMAFGAPISDFHMWNDRFSPGDYVCLQRLNDKIHFPDPSSGHVHMQAEQLILAQPTSSGLVEPRNWPRLNGTPKGLRPFDSRLADFMSVVVAGQAARADRLLPCYFADANSCDYAVLVAWDNPAHPTFEGYLK